MGQKFIIKKNKISQTSNEASEILKKLKDIKNDLKEFKEENPRIKLIKLSNEELGNLNINFKRLYKQYDIISRCKEELTEEEEKEMKNISCIYESIEIQGLISRISNRIRMEETRRTEIRISRLQKKTEDDKRKLEEESGKFKKQSEEIKDETLSLRKEAEILKNQSEEIKEETVNLKNQSKEIKEETSKLKESVITISSLVFMSFTFIQLNFTAFQNSKDYGVLDRLILFTGINLLLVIGIYSIFCLMKSLLKGQKEQGKVKINSEIKCILIALSVLFGVGLISKFLTHPNPEVENLEKELLAKKKEVIDLNTKIIVLNDDLLNVKKMINKLKEKENELDEKMLSIDRTFIKRDEENKAFLSLIEAEKKKIKKEFEEKELVLEENNRENQEETNSKKEIVYNNKNLGN